MIKRLLLAGLLASPSLLLAQATVQGHASAAIATPIALAEVTPMHFGNIVPAGGGVATLGTFNLLAPGAGLVAAGGNPQAGVFQVTGVPGLHYQVAINPAPFPLTIDGGGHAMDATITGIRFQTDPDGLEFPLVGADAVLPWNTLPAGGTETIHIAASLAVAGNQAPGIYNGTYDVTVRYQ